MIPTVLKDLIIFIGYNDCRDLNKFQQKFPVKKTVITSEWKSSFIHWFFEFRQIITDPLFTHI